jgi:hypothetical protein
VGVHTPVLVTQYVPDAHWESILHGAQIFEELQKPLRQSAALSHPWLFPHAEHAPPQSTPVSPPSCTPSVQWLAMHVPIPSHTTPPWSLQPVPLPAFTSVHTFVAQV